MNVLSLFDGCSCGQIALNQAGINYDKYFASEINKFAIKVTQKNYPDTIQLGDIQLIDTKNLPDIDLVIGGSPCQGFSKAGKGLNFDDPRSKLFFEYVRILNEIKPKYFLFENVQMKQEWKNIISFYLKCESILINSSYFTAQNRKRLYWTNIPIKVYRDKGILLKDILEDKNYIGIVKQNDKIFIRQKSNCLDAIYFKGIDSHQARTYKIVEKSTCICSTYQNGFYNNGKNTYKINENISNINKKDIIKLSPVECERLQGIPDNYTNYVSDTQRYKMIGNGWTIPVISHIFSGMKENNKIVLKNFYQMNLFERIG